jgi:hypothetical protein
MSMLNGPPHLIQTKKNQSVHVDLDLPSSSSSSSPSSDTGVGTGISSQFGGQVVVGSSSRTGPVYAGLEIGGRVGRGGFKGGGGGGFQLGKLALVLGPGPVVEFQFSGGPFVMRGHGGSVSVLVWVSPPAAVIVVTYGGKLRLYVGRKNPVVSLAEIFTFQKSMDDTVSGGGLTVMVLIVPGCINMEVV